MATTFTGHEFYSRRVLKTLPTQLNFLGAFSNDISDEVKDPGEKIQIALVEADAAGTFDRANNNFARPAGTPKKATVTFGDPLITGFAVTAAQARNIQRRWWEGKADLNVNSIAASASTAVTNLITDANFEKVVTNVGNAASFVKSGVGKIAAAVSNATNKLRVKFSTLALSGEHFYALASSLDANVYGGTAPAQRNRVRRARVPPGRRHALPRGQGDQGPGERPYAHAGRVPRRPHGRPLRVGDVPDRRGRRRRRRPRQAHGLM